MNQLVDDFDYLTGLNDFLDHFLTGDFLSTFIFNPEWFEIFAGILGLVLFLYMIYFPFYKFLTFFRYLIK